MIVLQDAAMLLLLYKLRRRPIVTLRLGERDLHAA
jgi:hypothetical protein